MQYEYLGTYITVVLQYSCTLQPVETCSRTDRMATLEHKNTVALIVI
jgi:hypothetical protein|eukprot:COSAG01_NODE_1417_length_10376_cov_8.765009_11_plen_47_part_00